jgi:DNA-binding IclR family transcriptional regulator
MRVSAGVSDMASIDSFFVVRTMQALEVLAFQPATAPQVAEVLRVDARTARRLLNRLADEGWLIRSEGRVRTYTLSLRLVALVSHFLAHDPLTQDAQEVVGALHEGTGAVAYVAVPSYRSVLCLEQRGDDWRSRPRLRELIPAHVIAAGKVLFAYRQPWRDSVLELPLKRMTARTVVEPDAVREECEQTVERGFAFEDGEYREGLQSIAAPVIGAGGDVMVAVGLTGTRQLNVARHVEAVRHAADTLRRKLEEAQVARAA